MDSSGYRPSVNVEDRRGEDIEPWRRSIAAQLRNPNMDWQLRKKFEELLRGMEPYDPISGSGGWAGEPSAVLPPRRPDMDMVAEADRDVRIVPIDEMPATGMEAGVRYMDRDAMAAEAAKRAEHQRFNEEMSRLITPRRLAEELMRL
jgi:hypothetical protein